MNRQAIDSEKTFSKGTAGQVLLLKYIKNLKNRRCIYLLGRVMGGGGGASDNWFSPQVVVTASAGTGCNGEPSASFVSTTCMQVPTAFPGPLVGNCTGSGAVGSLTRSHTGCWYLRVLLPVRHSADPTEKSKNSTIRNEYCHQNPNQE